MTDRGPSQSRVTGPRWLIVNADDFGRHEAINRGIVQSHEYGIVTSASLMVRWPAAADAATHARHHERLSVGLHVDLGEWVFSGGQWEPVYQVVDLANSDAVAVEVSRQLGLFRRMIGRDPSHLDSHQHVHRHEPTRSLMLSLAAVLNAPLRGESTLVRHCGDFYGQSGHGDPLPEAITTDALVRLLRELPAGVTELACHPGDGSGGWSAYDLEREREVKTLCDKRLPVAISESQIRLCNFSELQDSVQTL